MKSRESTIFLLARRAFLFVEIEIFFNIMQQRNIIAVAKSHGFCAPAARVVVNESTSRGVISGYRCQVESRLRWKSHMARSVLVGR